MYISPQLKRRALIHTAMVVFWASVTVFVAVAFPATSVITPLLMIACWFIGAGRHLHDLTDLVWFSLLDVAVELIEKGKACQLAA